MPLKCRKTQITYFIYLFLIVALSLFVLLPLFLPHHHFHADCCKNEIGHSEEFCPICWFIFQFYAFAFLIIAIIFRFLVRTNYHTRKNYIDLFFLPYYSSRAPPLTV